MSAVRAVRRAGHTDPDPTRLHLQSKIRAVHDAARAGNLRQLQAALDRRKFAVARDRRSSSAATPLHLAVLLGQTAVVRYLAGRFPETLSVRDAKGRSALHYAAVLADNGHYYNLLLSLGANRALKDKVGFVAYGYRAGVWYVVPVFNSPLGVPERPLG